MPSNDRITRGRAICKKVCCTAILALCDCFARRYPPCKKFLPRTAISKQSQKPKQFGRFQKSHNKSHRALHKIFHQQRRSVVACIDSWRAFVLIYQASGLRPDKVLQPVSTLLSLYSAFARNSDFLGQTRVLKVRKWCGSNWLTKLSFRPCRSESWLNTQSQFWAQALHSQKLLLFCLILIYHRFQTQEIYSHSQCHLKNGQRKRYVPGLDLPFSCILGRSFQKIFSERGYIWSVWGLCRQWVLRSTHMQKQAQKR